MLPFSLFVLLPTRGIVAFSGGIILGFLKQLLLAAVSSEAMASEHFRPPPSRSLYSGGASAPNTADVFSQRFDEGNGDHPDPGLDEEDRVLRWLLEAFPGISHHTLAIAYARADRDPNKAAEILSVEAITNSRDAVAQTSGLFEIWKPPPNRWPQRLSLEDEFSSFVESSRPKSIHSDDFSSKKVDSESHQLKNGHGDFAGASVWRNDPLLASHSRPPEGEASSESKPKSPDENGNWMERFPALKKIDANRGGKPNWGTRSAAAPPKLSATSGSVSNRMLRRASVSLPNTSNGSELTVLQREVELENGLYSLKMLKKKNKVEDGKGAGEGSGSGNGSVGRRASEDFLHSMLGGDFGIDLVRDVLDHYEGDTEKALETLLNIGSTSTGFDYRRDSVNSADLLYSSPGDQSAENGGIMQPARAFSQGIPTSLETDQSNGTEYERIVESLLDEEDGEAHKVLLGQLCEAFPTVEQSFLAQVLQAAEFSYDGALQILRESGLIPVGEQTTKPKLDPAEVLRTLFKAKSDPSTSAGPSEKPPPVLEESPPAAPEEPWNVVVGKPRISRDPDVQATAQKIKSTENEYARHRAIATEHWETMKMYMKEANAAYNRGDRTRAGVLSEKGARFKALAQAASARASQNIFNVRNKDIANNIIIDLHAQHVTEALRLLQLHLRTLSQVPSVQILTVITGQGSHSAGGHAKIKPAVIRYLDSKLIPWAQQNPGCIAIKMSDVRSLDANQRDMESFSDVE